MNKPIGPLGRDISSKERIIPAAVSLEKRRLRAYAVLVFGDLLILHAGFILAGLAYEGIWMEWRALLQAQLLLPLFYTIAFYNGTYSTRALVERRAAVSKVLITLLISAALLNFVAFYTKSNATFSRGSFTLGILFSFALMVPFRHAVVSVIDRLWGGRIRNELVIDDGGPSFALPKARTVLASDFALSPLGNDPFRLDRLGRLLENQDRVVVSCPPQRRADWALLLKSSGVQGEILSDTAHALGASGVVHYEDQERATLIVAAGPLRMRARVMKRAFDLIVAVSGLIFLSPILLWAALRIKLEDGGPVLFRQRRLGRGNRFFGMYKLRTMRVANQDDDGARSTARADDRVTRIGARLRSTSLDELPQLWNVIRGEMSIVGPRPHALASQANNKLFWDIDAAYWKRHALKPGLTGLAQVRGHRGNTEHEDDLTERLQSDFEYINRWSLWNDLTIVVRTLSVLKHERAF